MQRNSRFGLSIVVLVGCLLVLNMHSLLAERAAAATAAATQSVPPGLPITVANAQQVKALQSVTLANFSTSEEKSYVVVFDPTLHRIATVVDAKTVRVWNTETGKVLIDLFNTTGDDLYNHVLAFSPKSERLAANLLAVDGYKIIIWDISSGKTLTVLKKPETTVDPGIPYQMSSLAFSQNGVSLVSGDQLGDGGNLTVWNVRTGQTHVVLETIAVALSTSRNSLVAFMDAGGVIQVYNLETNKKLQDWEGLAAGAPDSDGPRGVALSPDGSLLAASSPLVVLSVKTGDPLPKLDGSSVSDLRFAPDGRLLVSNDNGKIHFWNSTTGKTLAILDAVPVTVLAMNRDGTRLASFDLNTKTVQFWGISGN